MVRHALGVSETWLNGAEEFGRLVDIYGPNGSHPAEDVITELNAKHHLGSGKLLTFLQVWHKDHPVTLDGEFVSE